jgi:putative lipase involved disintegration of autophagic bodies
LGAVERAKKFYGDIQIIVIGHSMGGAMAAFCALDLTVTSFLGVVHQGFAVPYVLYLFFLRQEL